MDNETEQIRRRAEIRKKRLLERGNARLRLICPNYDDSIVSNDLNDQYYQGLNSNETNDDISIKKRCNIQEFNINNKDLIDKSDYLELQISFLEYWNKELVNIRKLGSCFLGLLLFYLHHFISSKTYVFGIQISSLSGIITFITFQFLIAQYLFIRYYWMYSYQFSKNKFKWYYFFFNFDMNSINYLKMLNCFIQYALMIKNLFSDWFILLTSYITFSFLSNLNNSI